MRLLRLTLVGLMCVVARAESPKEKEFVPLFNGTDLKGWAGQTDGYQAKDGVLMALPRNSKGAKLYTAKEYANFIFRFEFKLTAGANNGIGLRAPRTGNPAKNAMSAPHAPSPLKPSATNRAWPISMANAAASRPPTPFALCNWTPSRRPKSLALTSPKVPAPNSTARSAIFLWPSPSLCCRANAMPS